MFAFPFVSQAILAATVASYRAGRQSFSFEAPAIARALDAPSTVSGIAWYPTLAQGETPQLVGPASAPFFQAGSSIENAPIARASQRFPLILLSHGTGGSAAQMAWLGTALARAGFIAVAVDHPGNNAFGKPTVRGFSLWWLRPVTLSAVIDTIERDPQLGAHVDPQRIGAAGFSLGGYTVIGLAGGRVDLAGLREYCSTHPTLAGTCQAPPEFPDLLQAIQKLADDDPSYRAALAASGASVADRRVRAVYSIAPAMGRAVSAQSLQALNVPVRIAYGTADTIVDPAQGALRYAAEIPGATVLPVAGAGHYTFLDTCTVPGAAALASLCTDGPGIDRDAVHEQVAADAVAFFERTL